MNKKSLIKILRSAQYVRTGGSRSELKCAEYIKSIVDSTGYEAELESFPVPMSEGLEQLLEVDGVSIPCKGYLCCETADITAPLIYLPEPDRSCLLDCKSKIVMIDGYLRRWVYKDLVENGAVGFITYSGNMNYPDRDIDLRELRELIRGDQKELPGVNINVKDAMKLAGMNGRTVHMQVSQSQYEGSSHNLVLTIPGELEKTIIFTAHYDSTALSSGAYDNMSGSVGLIAAAERFASSRPRHTLKFIWCGSEERGLLGSKAYCQAHESELENAVLVINLDMIGSSMGKFIACCTSEPSLVSYISYMSKELGFPVRASQGVYSSDSTPFSDKGVPSVSFARLAPDGTGDIHNRYDTAGLLRPEQLAADIGFVLEFSQRMISSHVCPVERVIPDNMKEELDYYLLRKKKPDVIK